MGWVASVRPNKRALKFMKETYMSTVLIATNTTDVQIRRTPHASSGNTVMHRTSRQLLTTGGRQHVDSQPKPLIIVAMKGLALRSSNEHDVDCDTATLATFLTWRMSGSKAGIRRRSSRTFRPLSKKTTRRSSWAPVPLSARACSRLSTCWRSTTIPSSSTR